MTRDLYLYSFQDNYWDQLALGKSPKLKIGETVKQEAIDRINQQMGTATPEKPIVFGVYKVPFTDKQFHTFLRSRRYIQPDGKGTEWFFITAPEAEKLIHEYAAIVNGVATPIREALDDRPYQHSFVEMFKASRGDFLLFAKCRSGKSAMTLLAAMEAGYRSALIVSYRTCAANSWRDDARRYTVFHEWDVIDLASKTWEEEIKASQEAGRRQLLVSTVQRQREEFGYRKRLTALYPEGVDLLALDECHIGGGAERFQRFKKNLKYGRFLEISGTAFKETWDYGEKNKFIWDYFAEQKAKAEGQVWAQKMPRMQVILAKYNTKELKEVYGDEPSALKNVLSVEHGEWKNPASARGFCRWLFPEGRIHRDKKLLSSKEVDMLHGLMSVPSVASAHLLCETLKEMGCKWAPLVVTHDTGSNQETIRRHIQSNPSGTLTITVTANVVGVTVPEWDTVINASEGDSAETWVQLAFRAGSTKRPLWSVIDLVPERAIQSVLKLVSATPQNAVNKQPLVKTFIESADVYDFEEGFEQLGYEELIKNGLINLVSAEAETLAAQREVTTGNSVSEMYEIFKGARTSEKVVFQEVINRNGTNGEGDLRLTRNSRRTELDQNAEVRKAVKEAVGRLDNVIWGALLHGTHLSSLSQVLNYDKFEMCTGYTAEQFRKAIKNGWAPPADRLNTRLSRIYHDLNASLEATLY